MTLLRTLLAAASLWAAACSATKGGESEEVAELRRQVAELESALGEYGPAQAEYRKIELQILQLREYLESDGRGELLRAVSSSGRETILVAPTPSPVPLNEPFELLVRVRDAQTEEPCAEAEVFVRAWMPDHGHGMFRRPEVEPVADGCFRVKGLLFHMGGHWELSVDVVRDGIASAATFDVRL